MSDSSKNNRRCGKDKKPCSKGTNIRDSDVGAHCALHLQLLNVIGTMGPDSPQTIQETSEVSELIEPAIVTAPVLQVTQPQLIPEMDSPRIEVVKEYDKDGSIISSATFTNSITKDRTSITSSINNDASLSSYLQSTPHYPIHFHPITPPFQQAAQYTPAPCKLSHYTNDLQPAHYSIDNNVHGYPCCPAGEAGTSGAGLPPCGVCTNHQHQCGVAVQCDELCPGGAGGNFVKTWYNTLKTKAAQVIAERTSIRRQQELELYRINICQANDTSGAPKRVVFDMIDGDSWKPKTTTIGTNTISMLQGGGGAADDFTFGGGGGGVGNRVIVMQQRSSNHHEPLIINNNGSGGSEKKIRPGTDSIVNTISSIQGSQRRSRENNNNDAGNTVGRIDVYYFDHGNSAYYRTTDSPGTIFTEILAERTHIRTAQYWAEILGTVHVAISFFTAFILQLWRFILHSLVRPLIVGLTQLTADYLIKPFLAVAFNALIQPPLIFLYNIATSIRDLCEPLADAVGYFTREVATVLRAIRIVEVRQHRTTSEPSSCCSSRAHMQRGNNFTQL